MKFKTAILVALILIVGKAYSAQLPTIRPMSKAQVKKWAHKLAITVKNYMWTHGERFITMHQPEGPPYPFEVTVEFLEAQIINDYDASRFNPSWGPRPLACIKEVDYQYGESRFDRYALNINKCGSFDMSLGQINSCHITMFNGEKSCGFLNFCKILKVKPNMLLIWNPYYNSLFSAFLNEDFIKNGQSTYHYYDTPAKRQLYDAMIQTAGLQQWAIQCNDGQYVNPYVEKEKKDAKESSKHWFAWFSVVSIFHIF